MDLSWLLPHVKGIPVLMYHKVLPGMNDALSIAPERLREQWGYLKSEGYRTLSLDEFMDIATGKTVASGNEVLLTFDDGYANNLQYAYPLLREMGFKATFFIIANTLDGTVAKEAGEYEKMTLSQLASLDDNIVQIAMHGYAHEDFAEMGIEEIKTAVNKAKDVFDNSGLPYRNVWAYAYGARPDDMGALEQIMADAGVSAAFRIGNRVSRVPVKDVFQIKRIDIRGTDTLEAFKTKLKKGKLKPF